jgi:uncharacterized protein (DUF2235 family)
VGRNLICLVDGTWLSAEKAAVNQTFSNIYRMGIFLTNNSVSRSGTKESNIIFYSRGLGAYRNRWRRYRSGAFASGIEEEIADVYLNLATNYERGDKIFLFGFSRGAVIARAVAGMIAAVGLLKEREIRSYRDVWQLYMSGSSEVPDPLLKKMNPSAVVEFIGVFDTVFGGNDSEKKRFKRLGFHNSRLPWRIRNAVHIIAMDERRGFFKPIPWVGGLPPEVIVEQEPPRLPIVEQIWMPGVHADIGGTSSESVLRTISLLTMVDRVHARSGLAFHFGELDRRYERMMGRLHDTVIPNEMGSIAWSIARRHRRLPDADHLRAYLHPIVSRLKEHDINYRGRKLRKYSYHDDFDGLKKFARFKRYDFV